MKAMRLLIAATIFCTGFSLISCGKAETAEKLPGEILNSQDNFTVTTELVKEFSSIDENFRIMQGGCVTWEYAWFTMVSAENYGNDLTKECYIIQYDRATMEEVKRSEVLKLGHANDMDYIPETNELYVSNCYADSVTILDADTLTVKEVKILKLPNYAIDYNESREMFVTAYDKAGMVFYDKDFTLCGGKPAQDTTLVTQGICADDQYVYHVLYSPQSNKEEPENLIMVLDWEGNLITKIPIGLKEYEPENISLVGDTFYIGFNNGDGGIVFTAKLVKN